VTNRVGFRLEIGQVSPPLGDARQVAHFTGDECRNYPPAGAIKWRGPRRWGNGRFYYLP